MSARRVGLALACIGIGLGLGGTEAGAAASLGVASQRLTPYVTCTITATPTTTAAVADTSVRQGTPGGNYGALTSMHVASGAGANRRSYLSFDVTQCTPAIPATATIRLAFLRLYMSGVPTVCRTLDVFRVTGAWTEAGLTWTNQPFGTSINNPPSASATSQFAVGTPVGCTNRVAGYATGATVTADVAAFVAGSATNSGWMIRDDVEGSATTRTTTFSTKNLGTLAQAPQLVITYVAVP
jgi:hypothetical protein